MQGEIRPGYKQTDVGVIPEDWEVDALRTVTPANRANGIVDGPFGSNLKTIHYRKSGIPIITSGYVTDGCFVADSYLYVDEEKFKAEKRSAVVAGDIVMAKIGARCGATAILPKDHQTGILSGNALKITVDENRHSTFYIWQLLWSLYSWGRIDTLRSVGAQPAISMPNLKNLSLPLPPLSEQCAIAAALSDADALIAALELMIAKKRDLKQAAMQHLLTGSTRLPGFSGEWEVKRLGDLAEFRSGYAFRSLTYTGMGRFRIITIANVQDGKFDPVGCKKVMDLPADIQPHQILKTNDLLMSMTGNVGRVCMVLGERFLLNQRVGQVIARREHSQMFLFQLLRQPKFKLDMDLAATGGAQGNIGVPTIVNYRFEIPPTLAEQTAIAEVLSDMDADLDGLEMQAAKARAVKQGMMQELLTGRVRLV
jgi:type I restriction enzyme S subunit